MVNRNPLGKSKKIRGKPVDYNKRAKTFPAIVESLINEADIIIEVLDSRFIDKTRNIEFEEKTKKMGKVLIYVFNKSDLVEVDKIKNTDDLRELKPGLFFSTTERKGGATLRKLIKIEAKKMKKDVVNIGIIGYPNTGKSSLINSLVGKSVSKTSSDSGYTKGIQKVKISDGVYLIDTPGVIPPEEKVGMKRMNITKHSKIGAVTWHKARDPEMIVFELMREYPGVLESHYGFSVEGDSEVLIEKLGRKINCLKKGNNVDEIRTAKQILRDWQEGKIKFNV